MYCLDYWDTQENISLYNLVRTQAYQTIEVISEILRLQIVLFIFGWFYSFIMSINFVLISE